MSAIPRAFDDGTAPLRAHRFSVAQFERLVETGVLGERVELLDGWIVDKMTQKPPHAVAVDLTQEVLRQVLPADWKVREQKPIRTGESEPEPDIAVVRGPINRYAKRHPRPRDIGLLIEAADRSLLDDRARKGRIYASARVAAYWIINLVDRIVEVYTEPKAGKSPGYARREDYHAGDLVPLVIAGKVVARIAVRDLLP